MAHATRNGGPTVTIDQERAQVRERLEFLERSLIRWENERLMDRSPAMRATAEEMLGRLRAAWTRERKKLDRLRSQATLPW